MKNFSKEKKLTAGITTVYDINTKNKIYEEAKKQGISQGELVRLAVQQYLEYLDLMSQAEKWTELIDDSLNTSTIEDFSKLEQDLIEE